MKHSIAVGEWHGWRVFCECGLDERCDTKEEAISVAKQHAHFWMGEDEVTVTADEEETVQAVIG